MSGTSPILTHEMRNLLLEQRLGFVATVCPDGTPNVSPKGTILPKGDNQLVFAHLNSPQTVTNLESNPAIEINVVDVLTRRGYRFKGTGTVHRAGDAVFQDALALYQGDSEHDALRDAESRVKAIVVVTIKAIRPLVSPAYDDGSTVQSIREQWRSYLLGGTE